MTATIFGTSAPSIISSTNEKSRLSVGGLHRFLKYQIAQLEGTSPELCKIVDAHYFRGRLSAAEAREGFG